MEHTKNYRRQHSEIINIVNEIEPLVSNSGTEHFEFDKIRKLLPTLDGKLSVHLSMEDDGLYPRLFASTNETLKVMAKTYMLEMGDLKNAFSNYRKKWNTDAIRENPKAFCTDTIPVLNALKQRIAKEENELYRIVDEQIKI